jgi:aspartyl-tRNA(Asn)/glutamyl-tRNA(Gln) amidotransferase subunit B
LSQTARISGSLAKQVLEIMLETGGDPARIVEEKGLKQTSDTGAIEAAIAEILSRQCRQGRPVQGRQGSPVRLLRRPDDEGHAGKANPQGCERVAEEDAGVGKPNWIDMGQIVCP